MYACGRFREKKEGNVVDAKSRDVGRSNDKGRVWGLACAPTTVVAPVLPPSSAYNSSPHRFAASRACVKKGKSRDAWCSLIYGRKQIDEDAARDLLEGCVQPDGTRKGGMSDRKVNQPSVDIMEAEITDAEVLRTIEHLPLGKSAGPNRIPNGVYKHLSSYYAPTAKRAHSLAIRKGIDSASHA
jgi:hypothetical protein